MTKCLTSPVVQMVPESSRPTSKSPSAAHVITASKGVELTSTDYLRITVSIDTCIKSTHSDDRPNTSNIKYKQNQRTYLMNDNALSRGLERKGTVGSDFQFMGTLPGIEPRSHE